MKHISYITANFPQMCLMLDQFLWGHSSRDYDISCLGDQKNLLNEMVLLSTHNICFGLKIRKLIFDYALLSGGLVVTSISRQRFDVKNNCSQKYITVYPASR